MKVESQERIDDLIKQHNADFVDCINQCVKEVGNLKDSEQLSDEQATEMVSSLVSTITLTYARSVHALNFDYNDVTAMKKGLKFMRTYKSSPLLPQMEANDSPKEVMKVIKTNPSIVENLLASTIRDLEASNDSHTH